MNKEQEEEYKKELGYVPMEVGSVKDEYDKVVDRLTGLERDIDKTANYLDNFMNSEGIWQDEAMKYIKKLKDTVSLQQETIISLIERNHNLQTEITLLSICFLVVTIFMFLKVNGVF